MKKGIFIIIDKEGQLIAAIRRADGGIVELDITVTPDIQKLDGQPCDYLLKSDKIVKVGGRDIFKQIKQDSPKNTGYQKPAQIDLRREMRKPIYEEPEVFEDIKKPNLPDSFSLSLARVPKDTREKVSIPPESVHNFALKLNQFARFQGWVKEFKQVQEIWENKFLFFNPTIIKDKKDEKMNIKKMNIFQQEKENFGNLFSKKASQIADRQTDAAENFFPNTGQLHSTAFKPEWRFVTGLGGHSVYETGITLHHIYGIPYIPASSIKGVLRSWIIHEIFGNNEGKAISESELFCKVFGCPSSIFVESEKRNYTSILEKAHRGKVTFFDAFPLKSPIIEPDIMNPHYPEWYSGKPGKAPVDTDNPNPVFFLTVKDTPFQFLIGSKTWNLETEKFWNDQSLGWWLENALSEHGIGAKTAVGYGYFKPV